MASRSTLQKLHDIGVEIALDDFGTGFGSLSHLKKLPIDRLKVDRSFVRDMETNPDNMAIVRTIAHLGQSLGIKVTVEGVETPIAADAAAGHGLRHDAGLPVLQAHGGRAGAGVPRRRARTAVLDVGMNRLDAAAADAPFCAAV